MMRSWEDSIKKATTPANVEWSLHQISFIQLQPYLYSSTTSRKKNRLSFNKYWPDTNFSITYFQTAHKCSTSSYVIVYRVSAANAAFGVHIQIDNQRDKHPYWGNEFTGTLANMTCTQISQRAGGTSIPTRSPIVIVIAHFASVSPVYLPQHTKMPSEGKDSSKTSPHIA